MAEIALPYEWEPRNYQIPAWEYFANHPVRARGVCVWHRRAGKDLMAINLIACKAHERVGTYWHIFPTYKQAKNVIWNGMTKDGRKFTDHFPKGLIESTNATELKITFKNGSIYQLVGTDNIDSLVGTNPIGCVFSEYALQNPNAWNYLRPILSENDGWALFIYTARGKNHGFKLLEMAKREMGWFWEVLVAGSSDLGTKKPDGTPVITDEMIEEERRSGMPEEIIQQEYYNSFESPLDGAYYSAQMRQADKDGRIKTIPHEQRLLVDTYWDLGMRDSTAIWFVQRHGFEFRVIDYYETSGEPLTHYVKVLKGGVPGLERFGDYVYGMHFAPHDIQVRELTSGKSRIETARAMGVKFRVVPQHPVEDGIDAVRSILGQCWFDENRCEHGLECLKSYRKERDEKNQVFRDHPLHDWSSHGADAFRMFAWSTKKVTADRRQRLPQNTCQDNFDYMKGTIDDSENDYPEPRSAFVADQEGL